MHNKIIFSFDDSMSSPTLFVAFSVLLLVNASFTSGFFCFRQSIDGRASLSIEVRSVPKLNRAVNDIATGRDTIAVRCRSSSLKISKSESNQSLRRFWTEKSDECVFTTAQDAKINDATILTSKSAKFTIRGQPLPLVRHRSSRGFMYNPSSAAQELFRDSLLELIPQKHLPKIIDDGNSGDSPITFFPDEFLEISIVFRLKRPKSHFVNNKPGEGRIKANAPMKYHPTRTDVDNLAKFVLDSLNGVLYSDDRQVVSLKATKLLDSEGTCDGATDVLITVVQDE